MSAQDTDWRMEQFDTLEKVAANALVPLNDSEEAYCRLEDKHSNLLHVTAPFAASIICLL